MNQLLKFTIAQNKKHIENLTEDINTLLYKKETIEKNIDTNKHLIKEYEEFLKILEDIENNILVDAVKLQKVVSYYDELRKNWK